jgi:hypothetical protein
MSKTMAGGSKQFLSCLFEQSRRFATAQVAVQGVIIHPIGFAPYEKTCTHAPPSVG